jgi:hypothetical protein
MTPVEISVSCQDKHNIVFKPYNVLRNRRELNFVNHKLALHVTLTGESNSIRLTRMPARNGQQQA